VLEDLCRILRWWIKISKNRELPADHIAQMKKKTHNHNNYYFNSFYSLALGNKSNVTHSVLYILYYTMCILCVPLSYSSTQNDLNATRMLRVLNDLLPSLNVLLDMRVIIRDRPSLKTNKTVF